MVVCRAFRIQTETTSRRRRSARSAAPSDTGAWRRALIVPPPPPPPPDPRRGQHPNAEVDPECGEGPPVPTGGCRVGDFRKEHRPEQPAEGAKEEPGKIPFRPRRGERNTNLRAL